MRGVGISSSGIGADLGGAEDELGADVDPVEGGGDIAPPETATGGDLGGGAAPATDQTI
jgi:hypothetical protein